jgi:hypothetical protein
LNAKNPTALAWLSAELTTFAATQWLLFVGENFCTQFYGFPNNLYANANFPQLNICTCNFTQELSGFTLIYLEQPDECSLLYFIPNSVIAIP